jgi:hypothetical protein
MLLFTCYLEGAISENCRIVRIAQAGRRLAVRVNARGQKLEYVWCDGQEGKETKVCVQGCCCDMEVAGGLELILGRLLRLHGEGAAGRESLQGTLLLSRAAVAATATA